MHYGGRLRDRGNYILCSVRRERPLLTEEQTRIVYQAPKNTVVFAAPGSGKTTALTRHIFHLVNTAQLEPAEIMAMTFTREAALEMRNRLRNGAKDDKRFEAVRIGTFHAQIFRVLLERHPDIPVLLSAQEQLQLMQAVLQSEGEFDSNSVQRWVNLSSAMKSTWPPNRAKGRAARILERYERLKVRHGRWDFDDILLNFCSEFGSDSSALSPLKSIKYLLIDEFQDINAIQWTIVQSLSSRLGARVFVVGDDDQSIYGFRGASPQWLLQFQQVYVDSSRHELSINFRSDRRIVSHAQSLIQHNVHRAGKSTTASSCQSGICMCIEAQDEHEEGWQISAFIDASEGLSLLPSVEESASGCTIGILARTRKQLIHAARLASKQTRHDVEFRTFHDAKGKEWDEVHILGSVYPNPYLVDPDAESRNTEEERRLFYVAMTRARHRLVIHASRKSCGRKVSPSRFIEEAELEIVSRKTTTRILK